MPSPARVPADRRTWLSKLGSFAQPQCFQANLGHRCRVLGCRWLLHSWPWPPPPHHLWQLWEGFWGETFTQLLPSSHA